MRPLAGLQCAPWVLDAGWSLKLAGWSLEPAGCHSAGWQPARPAGMLAGTSGLQRVVKSGVQCWSW